MAKFCLRFQHDTGMIKLDVWSRKELGNWDSIIYYLLIVDICYIRDNMERRRKNSERVHRFYAAKDEEEDSDSDEEEDEVLDFHKQKSEVIFWNDPRIK